jgi:hypothetical protein
LQDQDALRAKLKNEKDKRELKDLRYKELELQYNQLKKDVEDAIRRRDNRINEVRLKNKEKQEQGEALQKKIHDLKNEIEKKKAEIEALKLEAVAKQKNIKDREDKLEKNNK